MSKVYHACFGGEGIDTLYSELDNMRAGDILNLENVEPENKRIALFADSLLMREFKGKFLVSRREADNMIYGITVGRTAA